ncbi:ulp1 protease family protein [Colletotrichum incanum]|uniref:Ulp1 protease family protein n=1 Tax=Colletotrichum incanum TaxID=1573173 RepID=A0A162NNB4_COLIC|nr:ulp1 protease family protein [Colletotrichum incanum]
MPTSSLPHASRCLQSDVPINDAPARDLENLHLIPNSHSISGKTPRDQEASFIQGPAGSFSDESASRGLDCSDDSSIGGVEDLLATSPDNESFKEGEDCLAAMSHETSFKKDAGSPAAIPSIADKDSLLPVLDDKDRSVPAVPDTVPVGRRSKRDRSACRSGSLPPQGSELGETPRAKRPRKNDDVSKVTKSPSLASILDSDVHIRDNWLYNALQGISMLTGNYTVDSCAVVRIADSNHKPQARLARAIDAGTMILLPLLVNQCHWCLAVLEKDPRNRHGAAAVNIYDSWPDKSYEACATAQTKAFIQNYLPDTPKHNQMPDLSLAVPKQSNGIDCGVYVFAFGLHVVAKRPLRNQLHVGLWRRILAGLLGIGLAASDWETVIPTRSRQPTLSPPDMQAGDFLQNLKTYTSALNDCHAKTRICAREYYQQEAKRTQATMTSDLSPEHDANPPRPSVGNDLAGHTDQSHQVPAESDGPRDAKTMNARVVTVLDCLGRMIKKLAAQLEDFERSALEVDQLELGPRAISVDGADKVGES